MADISFLVFEDDKGFYRLEGDDPNNQQRIDMTKEEADAWSAAQYERLHAEEMDEDKDFDDGEEDGDGSGLHQCQYCYDLVTEEHEEFCRLNPNRNRNIVP